MRLMLSEKINTEKLNQVKETISTGSKLLILIWKLDRWLLLGVAISSIIPAFIPFANLYIYKLVIDQVVKVIGGVPLDVSKFYPLIGFRIATYFLQEVAIRTDAFVNRLLWMRMPMAMSNIALLKISTLDIQYFENSKFRDLLEKFRESYNVRPQQMLDHLFYTLQSLIQLLIAFGVIAKLNWFLVILVSAIAIPEFVSQTQRSKLSWGIWSSNAPQRKRYNYLQNVLQHPQAVKEVKIFGLAPKFISWIKELQLQFYKENSSLVKKSYYFDLFFNSLSTAVFVGVEIFVIIEALAKKVTVGDISFYTGVVSNFQNGMGGFFRGLNGIFENSLYVKNFFDVLNLEPIIKNIDHPVKIELEKCPKIEFKEVDFKYPETDKYILKNFSLIINPGEKVAFVGENGAGKSTIIKLLARFYDVDSGEILVNGVNVKNLDLKSWYEYLGILFQDFNRYEDTAKTNIHLGKVSEPENLDNIIRAATSAGAHQMVSKYEKGYEQVLGRMFEGGIEPSGGQWQKIALSRAFFRNAPVLVLDEPTSAIDAKAESEIFSRVEKLSRDKTVIIISHRFSTVRNADKIYVVDNGKIVESGTHQDLMKIDGQYATLFKLQAKGYQ